LKYSLWNSKILGPEWLFLISVHLEKALSQRERGCPFPLDGRARDSYMEVGQ